MQIEHLTLVTPGVADKIQIYRIKYLPNLFSATQLTPLCNYTVKILNCWHFNCIAFGAPIEEKETRGPTEL